MQNTSSSTLQQIQRTNGAVDFKVEDGLRAKVNNTTLKIYFICKQNN